MVLVAIHYSRHGSIHSFNQQLQVKYKQCAIMINKNKKTLCSQEHYTSVRKQLLKLAIISWGWKISGFQGFSLVENTFFVYSG